MQQKEEGLGKRWVTYGTDAGLLKQVKGNEEKGMRPIILGERTTKLKYQRLGLVDGD
jgi:hypothetical protein